MAVGETFRQTHCVLHAPRGRQDALTQEQTDRYLSLLSQADQEVVRASSFDAQATDAFRSLNSARLCGSALGQAVVGSLERLPLFQDAMRMEFQEEAAILHVISAFSRATGGASTISEADFPTFVRFCLAYRIHCYFETSCLQRRVSREALESRPAAWSGDRPRVVFVLGGPGAGKGTQCERICKVYGFTHLSTGDLLREERKKPGSEYAETIEAHIREGKLVPTEIIVKLLQQAMQHNGSGAAGRFLLDGFPRSFGNLELWQEVIADSVEVPFAVFFDCSERCMEARLLERGKTSGRSDDNAESIRKRFRTFIEESTPVAQHLESKGMLRRINAERGVEAVWKSVQATFGPSVVFVLGGPGCGKGTQCARITSAFGYTHLSAGDLLREERQQPGSAYGELIESHIKAGSLVPAEITVKLLLQAMQKGGWEGGKYLIDGFPRSFDNLEAWNNVVKGQVNVKFCLYIEVCEGVLEARLLERGKTSGRLDDNIESIRKRFITFHKDSLPVIETFKSNGMLKRIDGDMEVEDVWQKVQSVFGPSVVFVAGGPGAGKGTQCARIAETFGYTHLSSGDLLREERQRSGSEYGAMIEGFIREGQLVPSEVVVGLLKNAMITRGWEGGKYLIDGFPRGWENLQVWDRIMGSSIQVQFCLYFDCSEAAMEARLLERGKTSGRADDNLETIRKRFTTFKEESVPVLQTFAAKGKLRAVDADRNPEEVWKDVWRLFAPTVVLMLGGPGSGRGTQSGKVSPSFGFHHLSIGDLLREEQQKKDSKVGAIIDGHIREGTQVPMHIVLPLLTQAMEVRQWEGGRYMLDGFRSVANLEEFEAELGTKVNVPFALQLECSITTMRTRLLEYSKNSSRPDDTSDIIEKRLENYRSSIKPLLETLKRRRMLRVINAEQDVEEVCSCVQEVLRNELDPHIMNRAMLIIKPRAHTPETVRFVRSYLTKHKIAVLQMATVSAEVAAKKDLFNQHYFQIISSAEADPAKLSIPMAKQERFKEVFGVEWAEAVAKGNVLSAKDALQRLGMTSAQLFEEAQYSSDRMRLTPATYASRLNGVPHKPIVINGFAMHWRDTFFEGSDSLMWMTVEFDSATLSWENFLTNILGVMNPVQAAKDSIRAQLYEHWQALGLKEQPTTLYNGVHASGGPLQALHERTVWTNVKLEDDPLGRLLLTSGIPETTIDAWLQNPHVEKWWADNEELSGQLFDCCKGRDTASFRNSVLRYAKDTSMTLKCWPLSIPSTLPARTSALLESVSSPSKTGGLPKAMTILHFNDVYNVEPREKEPVGGIARFVTRVEELRKEAVDRGEEEAVVLFSGDAFNPSITSTTTRGVHMVPALNKIGIHTACFGNHDFDFGVDHLEELSAKNNFPWLISNVTDKRTGRPLANGHITRLMDFHGRRIGLLGLVEKEWLVTLATVGPGDIEYEDFCPCAQRLARQLKEKQGAEIVIALTHMRMPNDFLLAHEVAEVDIILGGHDHHYEVHPEGPHGTYVLNSGTDFRDMTEIRLEFNDEPGPRPFKVASTRHIEIDSSISEDPEMRELVDKCQGEVSAMMDVVLGETAVDLDCRFASIRTQETNIGNFVADVMRKALKTDVAVINSGTLRADTVIEKGAFKMRDLVSLLPMLDELCILQISGENLLSVLENSVSQYPRLEGRFAQVSGVTFTFDAAKPSGARLLRETIKISGMPLDLGRNYKLCTKDYLRQGKDGYDVFRDLICLADGEQAGILPTVVRDSFQEISQLNGTTENCPHHSTQNAEKVLGELSLERVGDGPDLMKSYAIAPKVEGRIICLNPVAC